MKTMKFFKKPALLLSIIAIAVVLTVSAIATLGFVQNGENTADLGEEYAAVQVSTSGKVSLKFYYSTTGTATGFVAEVTDPVTNEVETQNFAVEDLETTANGVCVPVALAPSQMTHTVKVYAVGENDEVSKNVLNYSVAEYANEILADASKSEYHDAMRALLNWGAMAQYKFEDATSVIANAGLFERNTNSMWGMNSFSYTEGEVVPGTTITGQTMNLSIEPNNIAIHFYVNYTGEGTLTATVSRDGGEAVATDVVKAAEGLYRVRIGNVPASMFDTPYTVTITDGPDTFMATKTVREYLGVLLAQCNENGDSASGNVARTMYQLYQFVTGNTGANTCTHGDTVGKVYWVSAADGAQRVRCIYCHADLAHKNLDAGVNAYAPATNLRFTGVTGLVDKTLMTEGGEQFVRFDNFYANRDNWGDISLSGVFAGNTGVSGQYLVIKYRVGTAGNGNTKIDIYANTNKGGTGTTGLQAKGDTGFVKANDNQWHTVVIDLANRVADPSVVFVDEGDGTYNVRYLSMRLFNGGNTVTEEKEGQRYTYVYQDAGGTKYTYYGEKLSDEEMTEKGYTLVKLVQQTVTADAYVDLAYVALCDSMADAKTLLDTAEYEWSISKSLSAYRNPADDSCVRHQNAVTPAAGDTATTYTAQCKACGTVVATQVVSNDVNFFVPYESMGVYTHTGSISKGLVEDGLIFNRYTFRGGCHANITGGDGAGSVTSSTYTTGKYVTFKYRWIDKGVGLTLNVATADKKDGNGASNGYQLPANTPVNEWRVAVVDVSDNAEWTTGSAQQIYTMFTVDGAGTLDIAYYAVVDSYAEAATLMGPDDEFMYDYGTSFASTAPIKRNNKGECLHGNISETLTDTACTYTCGVCGEAVKTITLPESVTLFYSPYNMSQAKNTYTNVTLNENNVFEDYIGKITPNTYYEMYGRAFVYDNGTAQFTFKGSAGGTSQFIWMRSMQDTSSASAHERYYVDIDQARYIVIKARASADALSDMQLNFSTSGYKGSKSVVMPLSAAGAEEWGVYVIDMSKVLSTYYVKNAETGTYELDFFYFHMSNFSTTDRIDLSYIAFVEDWAGVDTIVDEETVYNISDTSGGYNVVDTATHSCLGDHSISGETVNGTVHTIACSVCDTVFRTYDVADINYMTSLSTMNYFTGTTLSKNHYDAEEKVFYNSYGATQSTHWNFTGGGGAGSVTGTAYNSGSYIIMKVRATGADKTTLDLYLSTNETTNVAAGKVGALTVYAEEGWTTVILKNPVNANYVLNTTAKLYFMGMPGGDRVLDIAYLAVANTLDDAKTLLQDGENYKLYEGTFATLIGTFKPDGTCVEHNYVATAVDGTCRNVCAACGHDNGAAEHTVGAMQIIDGTYRIPCTVCGTILRDTGVKADAVGLYWSAEELYRRSTATTQIPSTEGAYWTGGPVNQYLLTEDGETFLRISDMETNHAANGAWGGWFPVNSGGAYAHPGSGRYMVIKVRQNDNSVNCSRIDFWVTSAGSSSSWSDGAFSVYLPEDNQWHVIVVDLAARASGYTTDTNGDYGIKTVHLRPFGGYSNMDTATDEIMDIAYMAFFDDLANLKDIIAEDTFEMSQSTSSSIVLDTETLGCAVHNATESVSGNTYTYTCTICGDVVKTVTIDESVTKYMSANVLNTTAKVYYGGSGNAYKYDADANVGYMETSRIQTIWQRMDHDMGATQTAAPAEQYTENVGNAKYLVIKARSSDAAANLRFCISTTAKNCSISTVTENDLTVDNNKDGVIDITTYNKIQEDGSTDVTKKCAAVGDQYYSGSAMKAVYFIGTGEATGEWVTYVIDLEAVCGEFYAKVEGQDYYDVDSFYFQGAGTNDIAYVAFVEGDWAEIDALVEEDVVMQITEGGSATATVGKLVNVADGSDAQ